MKRSSLLDLWVCYIGGMSKVGLYDRLDAIILNSVDLTCFQCLVALPTYLPSFGHIMLRCTYFMQLSSIINHEQNKRNRKVLKLAHL